MHRLSKGTIMRAELFMCFVLKLTLGPRVRIPTPPPAPPAPVMVYAADRLRAMVIVWFLFCVALSTNLFVLGIPLLPVLVFFVCFFLSYLSCGRLA